MSYSAIAGFFRQYEFAYVVGDERNLMGLLTTDREPPEDVYLYRVEAPLANVRRLFIEYAEKNQCPERASGVLQHGHHHCRTNIVTHVRRARTVQLEDAAQRLFP